MSFFFVEPDVYKKYKDRVLAMSQSIQVNYQEHLAPEKRKPGYTDQQIADELGLDARTVAEIRCVGERESTKGDTRQANPLEYHLVLDHPC